MDRHRIVGSFLILVLSLTSLAGCDTAPSGGTSQAPEGHTGMPPGPAGKAAPAIKK